MIRFDNVSKSYGNQLILKNLTFELEEGELDADYIVNDFESVVQKAVELGASAVIPLETAQCVVQYEAGKKKAKQERWQKIAMEAAKQSKRSHIPQVKEIQSLSDCLSSMPEDVYKIMLYEGRNPQGIKQILQRQRAKEVLLLVGPEGGFSASEVELCQRHGVHVVSMGPRILRTETAGLAGIAIVMYEYGDLGG